MKGNSYECLKTVLTLFVVSEYASGGSLADRLRNYNSGEGLPEFEVKKHTKNVLLGLHFIHGKGIVHCDIKPDNILLVTAEVAKIADFGLALTLEQSWTQKQGLRGTKGYMAPESVMAPESMLKQEYGPDTDIWALGCTVYELITGTPLWKSSNSDEKFDDVLHRIKYEELSFENVKLSTEAKDFVRNCLVKNPNSRWTADMLLNHSFLKSADNFQPAKRGRGKGVTYPFYVGHTRREHSRNSHTFMI